jgi:hypothetical protein
LNAGGCKRLTLYFVNIGLIAFGVIGLAGVAPLLEESAVAEVLADTWLGGAESLHECLVLTAVCAVLVGALGLVASCTDSLSLAT